MALDDNKAGPSFERAARNKEQTSERDAVDVPDMIKETVPDLKPTPPSLGSVVDAQAFDQRWRAEQRRAMPTQLDPFDQVDQKAGVSNTYNREADILGYTDSQLNAADDRLAALLEDRDRWTDQGLEPPESLTNRIDQSWQEVLVLAGQMKELEDSAKELPHEFSAPLVEQTQDVFDRVDEQAAEKDRVRDQFREAARER